MRQSFIQGALILLLAGMITRLLGFVPRMLLPRMIGAEGVGLYQMGYPLLLSLLTLITGGIPIAVAKLVAEAEAAKQPERSQSILRASLLLALSVGAILTLLCILLAPWISTHLLTDSRVLPTFYAMSPIVLLVAGSAVLRGYFQGKHNMIPTALSQITETLARCVCVLLFASWLLPRGIEYAAAGAMLGVMAGEVACLLILIQQYRKHRAQQPSTTLPTAVTSSMKPLLRFSIPTTGSRLVGSLSYFMESVMIVRSLAFAGIATAAATAQYGALQGMIMPIILLPGVLTYSLAISLIPSLSEAAARNDRALIHKRLHQSLRLALVTGAPFAVLLYMLAEPITALIYNDTTYHYLLKMMAVVALFLYIQNPLQATLQALNRPGTALFNTFIGAAIKLSAIYWLAGHLQWGIRGAVLAIGANIIIVTVLHWRSIAKLTLFSMKISHFMKTGAAMALMAVTCNLASDWFSSLGLFTHFFLTALVASIVYLFAVFLFKLAEPEDLQRIPPIKRFWR